MIVNKTLKAISSVADAKIRIVQKRMISEGEKSICFIKILDIIPKLLCHNMLRSFLGSLGAHRPSDIQKAYNYDYQSHDTNY